MLALMAFESDSLILWLTFFSTMFDISPNTNIINYNLIK